MPEEAMEKLKTASDIISSYNSTTSTKAGLAGLDKDIRNTYNRCKQQSKLIKEKEKKRAVAMFGGPMKDDSGRSAKTMSQQNAANVTSSLPVPSSSQTSRPTLSQGREVEAQNPSLSTNTGGKAVEGTSQQGVNDYGTTTPDTDPDEEPSFLEKHKELLICMLVGVVGSALVFQATTTTRRK